MANITAVWDFLKQNNELLDDANKLISFKKALEALASDDPTNADSFNVYKSFVADWLINGGAIVLNLEVFRDTVIAFENGSKRYFDVIQSFGQLVSAIGEEMQRPILNSNGLRVEVAGIIIEAYGNALEGADGLGGNAGSSFYDWWQSVTQTDAKREAEIYAVGLARSLDPAFTDATAKIFIDASKNSDFGIGESVEYIKNFRKLLGLGTGITAATANDVYTAVQDTRAAIHTLFGDSKFQISGVRLLLM